MCDVLFVCTGNTCRSPMAEGLLKTHFGREKTKAVVKSAGVSAGVGQNASINAVIAAKNFDADISGHFSSRVTADMVGSAKIVLTMTKYHKSAVKQISKADNVFTLAEFAGRSKDVEDPFGGSIDEYMDCAKEINELILICLENLKKHIMEGV